jgi:hypothetical protein
MPPAPISQQLSPTRIAIGWPRTFFVLTLILVILTISAQLLIASYNRLLASRSKQVERDIEDLKDTIPSEDLERLVKFDRQIRNLRLLLNNHVYQTRLLDEIERFTLPQVRYSTLNIHRLNAVAALRGRAPSMEAVSLQAAAFSQSDSITSVTVKRASISNDGGVAFEMDLGFKRSLLQPYTQ